MALVKVKRNYQITIPGKLRNKFKIMEGDYLDVEDQKDGIFIRPVKVVHPDQEYFYTKDWQEGEAEADKNIEKGELFGSADNIEDALKILKKAKI